MAWLGPLGSPGSQKEVQTAKDLVSGDMSSDPGCCFFPRGVGVTSLSFGFLVYSMGATPPTPNPHI